MVLLKKIPNLKNVWKKFSATDCMTLSTLMLVSHPFILMINIIEGTPDPEIGFWNENMSYSLHWLDKSLVCSGLQLTISEMEFHCFSRKEWHFFVKGLKLKATIRSSLGSDPFLKCSDSSTYMTSPAQLVMRRALLNGSLLSSWAP